MHLDVATNKFASFHNFSGSPEVIQKLVPAPGTSCSDCDHVTSRYIPKEGRGGGVGTRSLQEKKNQTVSISSLFNLTFRLTVTPKLIENYGIKYISHSQLSSKMRSLVHAALHISLTQISKYS